MTASGFAGGGATVCASSGFGFDGVAAAINPMAPVIVSVRSGGVRRSSRGGRGKRVMVLPASLRLSNASGPCAPPATNNNRRQK